MHLKLKCIPKISCLGSREVDFEQCMEGEECKNKPSNCNNTHVNDKTTKKFVLWWCVMGKPNLETIRCLRVDKLV